MAFIQLIGITKVDWKHTSHWTCRSAWYHHDGKIMHWMVTRDKFASDSCSKRGASRRNQQTSAWRTSYASLYCHSKYHSVPNTHLSVFFSPTHHACTKTSWRCSFSHNLYVVFTLFVANILSSYLPTHIDEAKDLKDQDMIGKVKNEETVLLYTLLLIHYRLQPSTVKRMTLSCEWPVPRIDHLYTHIIWQLFFFLYII